jgi:hypothetical protein
MTSQLLTTGQPHIGVVIDVTLALQSKPYSGQMTYVHQCMIRFNQFPDNPQRCQWMDADKDSTLFVKGEHVRVVPKNFRYDNYFITKDQGYIPHAVMENSSFHIADMVQVNADTGSALTFPDNPSLVQAICHTAIMGAATFTQYRGEMTKVDLYEITEELIQRQLLILEQKTSFQSKS